MPTERDEAAAMTSGWAPASSFLGLLCRGAVVGTLVAASACDVVYDAAFDPGAPKESDLTRFVREGAHETELAKVVSGTTTYRKGTPDWTSLEVFLAREPKNSFRPLREAMGTYPTIVYHTTAWRITWVFVDASGVVRGYYLCAQ